MKLLKPLGTKGQYFSAGMSLAYALVMFCIGLFSLGVVLMSVSDNMLGIYIHDYAVQYNADSTVLGLFETMRQVLPFVSILSLGLGMIALGHALSSVY